MQHETWPESAAMQHGPRPAISGRKGEHCPSGAREFCEFQIVQTMPNYVADADDPGEGPMESRRAKRDLEENGEEKRPPRGLTAAVFLAINRKAE
jgi:hypothetical protein